MINLEPSRVFKLKGGQELIFKQLEPQDAESFLKFRSQVPLDSAFTSQYVGMPLPSIDEMAKRLADQVNRCRINFCLCSKRFTPQGFNP